MAERTVIWKAIADFSSIARSAALARKELQALERRQEQQTNKNIAATNRQVASNDKLVQSNRDVGRSAGRAADQLARLSQTQREAGDATVRLNSVLGTTNTSLGKMGDQSRKSRDNVKGLSTELDAMHGKLSKTNAGLVSFSENSASSLGKISAEAARAKKEMTTLSEETNRLSLNSQVAASRQEDASRRMANAAKDLAKHSQDASSSSRTLGREHVSTAGATDRLTASTHGATEAVKHHEKETHKTSTTHRHFRTNIDWTSAALMRLKGALASALASGGGAGMLQRLSNALGVMDADTRRATSGWQILDGTLKNFKGEGASAVLSSFAFSLAKIAPLALLAGDAIGGLAGAIGGLGTGLMGMLGSLGPVIGLLGVLPGFATAAAGAFGTTAGALGGVMGALKAYNKEQKTAATASDTSAKKQIANNKKIAQSEQALENARRVSARQIRDAERGLRDARERAARTQVDTARSIVNAEENLVRSKQSVVRAERDVLKSQLDINSARVEARRNLKDLEKSVKSYALQEEGAGIALEEARKRLTEVMNDPGSTDLQRRAANLAVREAEARLEEVREASEENDRKLAEARRKGIEGSDQVVAAIENEQRAQEGLSEARKGVTDAERNLARAREDGARAIRDANEAVVRAEENLAEAKIKSTQAIDKSADALEAANAASVDGVKKTNAFADAMAKLTPEARAVVYQLIEMQKGLTEMRKAAERAVLPGFLIFLQNVEKLFPRITQFVSEGGAVMGKFFADFGRMLTTKGAMEAWNIVLDDAVKIMENWAEGLLNVAAFIGNVAKAAAESGLNDWLGEIIVGWTGAWRAWTSGEEGARNLNEFFKTTMDSAERIGRVISGLAGFLYNTGRIGKEAGDKIWDSFANALDTFNKWSHTKEGFESIKAVADSSVPVFRELGNLIVAMARGMGELSVTADGGGFLKQLRTEFGPVLMDILKQLRDTSIIGNFVSAISSIGRSIVDSGLLVLISNFAVSVFELAREAIPALTPLLKALIGIFDGIVRGLTGVFRAMNQGNAVVKALVYAFLGLMAIAGFGILLKKIKDFIKSFREGFGGLINLTKKFSDSMENVPGIGRFVKLLNQALRNVRSSMQDLLNYQRNTWAAGIDMSIEQLIDAYRKLASRAEGAATRIRVAMENARAKRSMGMIDEDTGASAKRAILPKDDFKRATTTDLFGKTQKVTQTVVIKPKVDTAEAKRTVDAAGKEVGKEFGEGVKHGAERATRPVKKAGEKLGEAAVDGAEDELDIKSPSRKGIKIGANFGGAIADGAESKKGENQKAGSEVGESLADGAESGLRRGWGRVTSLLGSLAKIGGALLVAGGTAAVGFMASAVQSSTTLRETMMKTNQVFKESAGEMEAWASTTANSMGLSKAEALSTANGFGTLLLGMGFTRAESAQLARELTGLSAALAASNPGVDVVEAHQALESALQGDYTAIQRLNPALNQSAVDQRALAMTGKKTTEELTEQERRAAFLALAHGQASDSSKILADRQETVAGKIESAKKKWEDFKAKLGEKVENKLGELAADMEKPGTEMYKLSQNLKALLDNEENITTFATSLTVLATALLKVAEGVNHVAGLFTTAPKKTDENKEFDKANKDELKKRTSLNLKTDSEISGISKMGILTGADEEHVIRVAKKYGLTSADLDHRRGFREASGDTYAKIIAEEKARREIQAGVRPLPQDAKPTRQQPVPRGGAAPGSPAQAKKAITENTPEDKRQAENDGKGLWESFYNGWWMGIAAKIDAAQNSIRNWFGGLVQTVKNVLGIRSPSTVMFGVGTDLIQGFIDGVTTMWTNAYNTVAAWFGNIIGTVKSILGISSPSTIMFGVGLDLIQGFMDGITAKWSEAWGMVTQWFTNIVNTIKNVLGIRSPSTVADGIGKDLIQGFMDGITSKWTETWNLVRNFFNNVINTIKNLLGISSPSTVMIGIGVDLIQGFLNGVNSLWSQTMTRMTEFVDNIGRIWDGLREKTRAPVAFVMDTVYNKGVRGVWNPIAKVVGLGELPEARFATGGWTGPGATLDPAGVVHADEYVVRKSSRRRFEKDNPGLLDYINRTGQMPAKPIEEDILKYRVKTGKWPVGKLGETGIPQNFSSPRGLPIPSDLGTGSDIRRLASSGPKPGDRGEGGPVEWGMGQLGRMGWYRMCLNFVNRAWNYTVGRFRLGTARQSQNAGPRNMQGGPPAGAAVYWDTGGWAGHVALAVGDGTELSNDIIVPGRIDRVPSSTFISKWGAKYMGWWHPGNVPGGAGNPLAGAMSAVGGLFAPVVDYFSSLASTVTEPIKSMKGKFGDTPFVDAMTKLPTKLMDKAKEFLQEKLNLSGALAMSGDVAGSGWQANANLLMKAGKEMGLPARAMQIALMTAAQESSMGTNRTAMTRANRDGDVGWFQQRTTRGDGTIAQLADPKYALGVFINGVRASNGWHVPGLYNKNWMNMGLGQAAQAVQVSAYPSYYDKWADDALRWMKSFGYSSGGWTGPGHMMKPAGVVHADEFVVRKSSRRKFERNNPGALDHINRTGTLPGYHAGGVVKTGGTDGAWWTKGTSAKTNKWIGALRNYLGLDEWWLGWDDNFDRAIRNYSGGQAAHVWGPWRGIIDGMRRLPLSEFSSTQNVASKIGVHPDSIFRMMDTNWAHFTRDLGDNRKVDALRPSYDRFRAFHKDSVEELQAVMGVEVTGYWTEAMRQQLTHIKHHVAGTAHPDNAAQGGEWSTVGSWGDAFNEVHRTIQINAEWDKMIDAFYAKGYDSLIRHLNEKGVAEGMELARDLYRVPLHAQHADAWYRTYYEREDAIKDENSELNRLRRLVNYIRRYDNVGLQGLASELQLTMDTTAMLFRKAQSKDMLNGIGSSKISRLNKDVIDFDKLFRFALGGLVPGQGNMDSVFALLTPGEYVLTQQQTKDMFAAQKMFATYKAPAMSGNMVGSAALAGAGKVVNNNVTNNIDMKLVTPDPHRSGVAVQRSMKKLADDGLFGTED